MCSLDVLSPFYHLMDCFASSLLDVYHINSFVCYVKNNLH